MKKFTYTNILIAFLIVVSINCSNTEPEAMNGSVQSTESVVPSTSKEANTSPSVTVPTQSTEKSQNAPAQPKQQTASSSAMNIQNPFLINEPQIINCLVGIFGQQRYKELQVTQPTQTEIDMINPCMPLLQASNTNAKMPKTATGNQSSPTMKPGIMPPAMPQNQDFQKYVDLIKQDPTVCYNATGMLADVCKMGPAPTANTSHDGPPPNARNNNEPLGPPTAKPNDKLETDTTIELGPLVDPDNPPKIATYNFIDLKPFVSISKIRAITGHMYSYGDSEYDATGKSCRSMKHYFESYTKVQRWNSSFGSYNTKGNINFYAPTDGTLTDVVTASAEGGTEYQFRIQSSLQPRIGFSFHHIDLLPELRNGAEVSGGQLLGTMYRNNGQGEIATFINTGEVEGDSGDYISFFDVMSDDVFAMYQAKGIQSRSQMTIPLAEREANPIGCTIGDGKGAKFIPNQDELTFAQWQDSTDNWVFMKN